MSPYSLAFARSIVAFEVDESRGWLTHLGRFLLSQLPLLFSHLELRSSLACTRGTLHPTQTGPLLLSPAPAACKAEPSLQLTTDELRNGLRLAAFAAEAVSRRLAASQGSYDEVLRQARSQAGASFSCRAESVKRGQEATRQQQQRRRQRAQYAVA